MDISAAIDAATHDHALACPSLRYPHLHRVIVREVADGSPTAGLLLIADILRDGIRYFDSRTGGYRPATPYEIADTAAILTWLGIAAAVLIKAGARLGDLSQDDRALVQRMMD